MFLSELSQKGESWYESSRACSYIYLQLLFCWVQNKLPLGDNTVYLILSNLINFRLPMINFLTKGPHFVGDGGVCGSEGERLRLIRTKDFIIRVSKCFISLLEEEYHLVKEALDKM